MSKIFPSQKDNIIDDMDRLYYLNLSDEEHDRLRCLTASDLFLVAMLLARATKNARKEEKDE